MWFRRRAHGLGPLGPDWHALYRRRYYRIPEIWVRDWVVGARLRGEPFEPKDAIVAWAVQVAKEEGTNVKFIVEINCDNDAFQPEAAEETANILEEVARRIKNQGQLHGAVHDLNGNAVGTFAFKEGS